MNCLPASKRWRLAEEKNREEARIAGYADTKSSNSNNDCLSARKVRANKNSHRSNKKNRSESKIRGRPGKMSGIGFRCSGGCRRLPRFIALSQFRRGCFDL